MSRLTYLFFSVSQDPSLALTSGQWMTEVRRQLLCDYWTITTTLVIQRPGGSDVSQTETVATLADNDASSAPTSALGVGYRLSGFKWFSSATDGDVALALARTGSF